MSEQVPPPANGTDIRLDHVLDELRAIRGILTPAAAPEPSDGEPVELREPARKKPAAKAAEKATRA